MTFQKFKTEHQRKDVIIINQDITTKPLVSVCVQTYQHQKYIKKCLNSILEQKTNFSFEILLGEDESSDGTREICLEFAKKYPEIIKLCLNNRHNNIKIRNRPSGRFNFLHNFSLSNGKYIAMCEGDDYWTDPLKLQKQIDFLENHRECSFCFHKARLKDEARDSMIKEFPENLNHHQELNAKEYLKISSTATSSLVFRKLNIKALYELLHSHGDFLLYCELLQKGKAGFIDESMSVYRKHEDGISYNYISPEYLLHRIEELKKEIRYFSDNEVKQEIKRIHKEHILRYISLYNKTLTKKQKLFLILELIQNSSFLKDVYHKFFPALRFEEN